MSNLRLFTLNPATFLVDLDKEWISTIKEFKVILVRDKGAKGDTQARKKLQAQKEFTFHYDTIGCYNNCCKLPFLF